jgi:hypothetical protein
MKSKFLSSLLITILFVLVSNTFKAQLFSHDIAYNACNSMFVIRSTGTEHDNGGQQSHLRILKVFYQDLNSNWVPCFSISEDQNWFDDANKGPSMNTTVLDSKTLTGNGQMTYDPNNKNFYNVANTNLGVDFRFDSTAINFGVPGDGLSNGMWFLMKNLPGNKYSTNSQHNNSPSTNNPQVGNALLPIPIGTDHTNIYLRNSNGPSFASPNTQTFFYTFSGVPADVMASGLVKFRIYRNDWNDGSGNDMYADNTYTFKSTPGSYNTYQLQSITPSSNLSATTNLCNKVVLNWSNPGVQNWVSQVGGCSERLNQYSYIVYRDGTPIKQVNGKSVNTFTDSLSLSVGTTYNYKIKTIYWGYTGNQYIPSEFSNLTTGSLQTRPTQVVNPLATENRCDSSIKVSWDWFQTAPDSFVIQRSTAANGTFSQIGAVSGNSRFYINNSLTRGARYYYKIFAQNGCRFKSDPMFIDGVSPTDPVMASNISASTNTVSNSIIINWTDNSTNETKYQIIRTDDLGNTILTDVDVDATTYTDNTPASCRAYIYKVRVFNNCVLSGVTSTTQATATLPPPNLGNTFTSTKKLVASKGYFGNRVELSWSNNNGVNIDNFKIYRKQLGTSFASDSVQLTALPGGNALYIDNTADARVFYRYTIVGIKTCNGSELQTNISSDIGFRNPAGIVSGHIEYNGGVAVNGAKVLIQPQQGANVGSSLNFANGGFLTINDDTELEPGAQMRCEFWFKPLAVSSNVINKGNAFCFRKITGGNYEAIILIGGVGQSIIVPQATYPDNQWSHVAMIYNGSTFKLFANGVLKSTTTATGLIDNTTSDLVFGDPNSSFLMDEFRLVGQAQPDSIITIETNRILNGDETNFKCNLHFDEATGNFAYDPSKVGNSFNGSHGAITGNVTWSSDRPTSTQLGYFGVTDALGNYNASGIRFIGTGENFNLIPKYLTHAFSPNSRSVYIGDGSQVFNNQDFTDISSFSFSGTLFYKGTTCPVPNVGLKIDGLPVVANGQQAVTDANGTFSISVPIGNHYVSAELFNHFMENGRYPATGTFDFQAPISGVTFTDSTLVTLVGRIVGGKVEADKAPGLGRSVNNIGKARLRLVTPLTGSPCFTVGIITNAATGEYLLRVPPLAYKIDSAFVITNSVVIGKSQLSNTNQVLDLTATLIQLQSKDTLKDNFGGVISVDSMVYHKRHDMIYRNTPIVDVTLLDGSKLIGDDTLKIGVTKIPIKPIAGNLGTYGWGPFNWPVFSQDKTYSMKINANEIYTNTDNSVKDTVSLSGGINITNQMVNGIDPNANFSFTYGVGTYSFTCGSPNTASNTNTLLSYARDIQIVVVPDGASSVSWLPNTTNTPTNKNFHSFVIGKRITGTGIATQGPEKVDFILRDPPGSGSSATWATGTSVTKASDFKIGGGVDTEMSATIELGIEMSVGIGVETETEVDINVSIGLNTSTSAFSGEGFSETITSSNAVSTRDDADNVGAPADIFIGRSRNWLVGPTANVEIVNAGSTPLCFGPIVSGKQMARNTGFAICPSDVKTRFSYTQNEIETVVIPWLEAIRNTILTTSASYTPVAAFTNPLYGSNNDEPLWGAAATSTTPSVYDKQDTTGSSYIFKGWGAHNQDTVRILNTQIALWKQALAQNEREKLNCKNNTAGILIDNFTLGSAIVTNAYSTDKEESSSIEWELALSGSIAASIGAEVGGVGMEVGGSITLNETQGGSESEANTNSTSFEYTLTDGDPGDIMSIDVYKMGVGNVFITRGGQTMCPYEDAVVCHYYNPANPAAWISSHTYNAAGFTTIANATVQREMPDIQINPTTQLNIPSNQAAVYQLLLSNQSPLTVNNDIDLQVRIASASNPYGAVLKIDGLSANTIINIPSGGSVVKTLTIERGPIEIDYDSLMVIFSSACSEDIADTAYVTVHFIPTCTDLAITAPVNNFVINNFSNNLSNIIIEDYNYNYGVAQNTSTVTGAAHPEFGFEKLGFEFKPSNSSSWLQIQDFYKTPAVAMAAGASTLYPIPNGQVYTPYSWTVTPNSYADGNYEIRAKSSCYNKDGSYAVIYSPVLQGVMDRVNPAPFGTPSPGDGILDPNDDISIQFNEPIDISSLSYAPASNPQSNFDIRGVLNGTDIRHSESLNFDGTANYAEVVGGAGLQKRDFTIEFWAKLNALGINQTVISQGTDPVQKITIGFDNFNKLKFALGNQIALSTNPVSLPSDWHHYAVVYDYTNADAILYVDGTLAGTNNNFLVDYTGSGKLAFGKDVQTNSSFLNGNLHEVRLWNKARTLSDITVTMNKVLNRNQSGLVYNWKMDEADGSILSDGIRSRNADIYGATWEVNPNGNAAQFDGIDDNIKITSGNIAINKEMDFTLEFWFNSTQPGVATLFANGKGDGIGADSLDAWNIEKDASGQIHVKHKGLDFVAVSNNYFNGNWHHFALVMNRNANLSAYVDGNLQNTVLATLFNNLAGSYMYLGARGYQNGTLTIYDNYYNGKMDEFRFWNTARKTEQIKRDKQNRMLGNESGLQAFIPFEFYATVLGTPSLTPTFNNQSLNTLTVTAQSGTNLIVQTPTIKLPRPIESVNYTWSLNNDKIILSTNSAPEIIENVTLDITVKNALDMHGNVMQSPKTWIAYINKNQVKWQDDQFDFEKTVDSVITFVAPIANTGGALKAFTIAGLPSWITANVTSGNIAPNSTQNIVFTIPAGGSIGDFNADITVTTDFNYDEVLRVNLKVLGIVPTWSVNPSNFQYSMNIFGQMKIDNVIATNAENKIAAFNNGVICGVANLQYIQAYDRYEVFLNVYSNQITGDSIRFNIYDASTGLTFVNVTPSLLFVENDVIGTVTNPITFTANTEIGINIPLNTGWTWVSFPLQSNKLSNSNLLMNTVSATNGDIVRSSNAFDQYDASSGWIGNISQGTGFFNNQSYKIKLAQQDTLLHIGARINPDSTIATINVVPGWNWIGYVATKNVAVSEALGNYTAAVTGDLIKSQYEFAYYDNLIGWTGSLINMKPTMGYMLKSASASTFNYPLSSFIGKMSNANNELANASSVSQNVFPFTPELYDNNMSAIITGNICNAALEQGNVVIGAFDATNTLRGYAYPTKNTNNSNYKFYLTLYSNIEGEALTIKYFNLTDATVIATNTVILFANNTLVGTPATPFNANVENSLACNVVEVATGTNEFDYATKISVYPNPFSDNLTLRFNNAVSCNVELVDVLGKVIYATAIKSKKECAIAFDANKANISAGMYYIRLTGDVNQQIKVVKTK